MARMTEGQANNVLRRLIENGMVNSKDVSAIAAQIQNEIESLEEQRAVLRQTSGGIVRSPRSRTRQRPAKRGAEGERDTRRRKRRRKQNLTPERRAKLQLQGHYLALMRRMPKTKRSHYKKLFKDEGVQAAIMAMDAASR
jgi:hypothetical protein